MSEALRLTVTYEHDEDGWIVARVPEVRGAISQGRTRDEARENVIDALHGILALRLGSGDTVTPTSDSDSLELVITT